MQQQLQQTQQALGAVGGGAGGGGGGGGGDGGGGDGNGGGGIAGGNGGGGGDAAGDAGDGDEGRQRQMRPVGRPGYTANLPMHNPEQLLRNMAVDHDLGGPFQQVFHEHLLETTCWNGSPFTRHTVSVVSSAIHGHTQTRTIGFIAGGNPTGDYGVDPPTYSTAAQMPSD
ncbi:hypothetical protein HDU87_002992 [Geranomyces variabilis]|uniref:Uncharacterized protein n=1 Tax=Geranomyces variabilis TaxID=109894 RepID=A0AAD5XN12_9FUNG|nr:hypothetical protein HDU87_002992 [Geranomyces variabilis]